MRVLRTRVSVSLPADLVQSIDREAESTKGSRSGTMEEWLRYAARRREQEAYAAEVQAYYRTRTPEEAADDEAIATASTRAYADLEIDEPRAPAKRSSRRRRR